MMYKTILTFGAIVLCMYTLNASVLTPNQYEGLNLRALVNARQQLKEMPLDDQSNGNRSDVLCDPCKQFFTVLKEIIGDVNNMTKDTLTRGLNLTCKYLEGELPFVDKICKEFGPKFIDILYSYLTEVDDEIDPTHDCKLLFLCWDNDKTQKEAIQEMIIKHKIRFD